jgi:hypothetical protein
MPRAGPARHAGLCFVRVVHSPCECLGVSNGLVKLSVGLTSQVYLLDIEGLFTQGSRPGRISGESVGWTFALDCSDWSNGLRYHFFDT